MSDQPIYGPFINRKDAQSQGLRHYFTGQPCRNGHVSIRGVKKWNCLECDRGLKVAERIRDPERVRANERRTAGRHREKKRQYVRDWRERNPEYAIEAARQRYEAIKADPQRMEEYRTYQRDYNMDRRREEGVPTRQEYHDKRLAEAVQKANDHGKVVIEEVLGLESGKRRVRARCIICETSNTTDLLGVSQGNGIQCKCKKYGESSWNNIKSMATDESSVETFVYLVPTIQDGLIKYGITNNLRQRLSSHRHEGLISADQQPIWIFPFPTRWQACLWELVTAYSYPEKHDRSLDEFVGGTEVLRLDQKVLVTNSETLMAEICQLTALSWESWADARLPKAAKKYSSPFV